MKNYKIVYQYGHNRLVALVKAENLVQAEYLFIEQYGPGAIIQYIEEDTENNESENI